MTDSQDPKSCQHGNVTTVAGEFEHYDRLGPGCWHPVDGGQCRSWQALIEHVQSVAAARAEARVRAEVAEEIADKIEMNVRNPDFDNQDRGGWRGFAARVAYIAGHDNAAKIARTFAAGSSPDTTPEGDRG